MINRPWTVWDIPGMIERMIALSEDHLSTTIIAQKLSKEFDAKVTRNAVIGKIHRLKVPHRTIPGPKKLPEPRSVKVRLRNALLAAAEVAVEKAIKAKPVSFDQLNESVCHYPIEGLSPPYNYCGAQSFNGTMYCVLHNELMHVKPRKEWK